MDCQGTIVYTCLQSFLWSFFMDLIQWGLSSFHTQFPNIQAVIEYYDTPIIYLQEIHPHLPIH